VSEGNGVFATHGYGLCSDYVDVFNCWDERQEWPWPLALYVSLTGRSLLVSLRREPEAFPRFTREGTQLLDTEAGRDSIGLYPSPAAYWNLVSERVVELPQ
jgi:hypothetical protein